VALVALVAHLVAVIGALAARGAPRGAGGGGGGGGAPRGGGDRGGLVVVVALAAITGHSQIRRT
jgi:hypothetical protein